MGLAATIERRFCLPETAAGAAGSGSFGVGPVAAFFLPLGADLAEMFLRPVVRT